MVAPSSMATSVQVATAASSSSLGLEAAPNARDLGGIKVTQGGHVRPGVLFRGPKLNRLTPSDTAKVESLGLRTIIDLRTPEESEKAPDPNVPGASNVQLPLLPTGDALLHAFDDASTTEEYRAVVDSLGGPVGSYVQLQHALASPYAVSQLRAVFQEILDADGAPVLFHCSVGMDRTGITAYLLLRVLGVSHANATQDYLTSNIDGADTAEHYIEFYESLGYSKKESTRGSELDAKLLKVTVDHLLSVYGSFDELVRYGLGLSAAEVKQLRGDYVVTKAQ